MSRVMSHALLTGLSVFFGYACAPEVSQEDGEVELAVSSDELAVSQNPALRLAAYGHGKAVDEKGAELPLTLELVKEWHAAMRAEIVSATGNKFTSETAALIKEADGLLGGKQQYSDAQKEVLLGAVIWRMLREAPAQLVKELRWRNDVLISVTARDLYLPPPYADLLYRTGYTNIKLRLPQVQSSYMKACAEAGVPIPPDWRASGTDWVKQGALSLNMLQPGQEAIVYTWRDPRIAGGCVALPRGDGAVGTFAGIICQSASTGRACFWDNNLKTDPYQIPIGWRRSLRLAELNDGSTLNAPCTECHTGKNVFLLSPDDETWGKLMRAPGLDGGTSSFTTRVTASSDNSHGYPRYVPMTTTPPRAEWVNTFRAPVCSGACHEAPSPCVHEIPDTMPPACGMTCSTY